jgi:hypothetical protein
MSTHFGKGSKDQVGYIETRTISAKNEDFMATNKAITLGFFGEKETVTKQDFFDWQLRLRKSIMHFEFHQN